MMDLFAQNLALLQERDPGLAQAVAQANPPPGARLDLARNGQPVLMMEGARLMSGVDPAEEGRTLAAAAPSGPLVVFGLGLGYHLEPLAGRDLLVVQPDHGFLRLALSARDLGPLLGKITLVSEPPPPPALAGRSLFRHRASAKAWPLAAAALERALSRANLAPARPDRPRVLVVPALDGGSAPMAAWCAQALVDLGADAAVTPLGPAQDFYRQIKRLHPDHQEKALFHLTRSLSELTLATARERQPHLVLALAQAPLDPKAIAGLKETGAVTAMWFVEDFRQRSWFREVAPRYDRFFHIQGAEMAGVLTNLGVAGAFLPMAAHAPLHHPRQSSPGAGPAPAGRACFVGAAYPNRAAFFRSLLAAGVPLALYGPDWAELDGLASAAELPGQRLSPQQTAGVYARAGLVVNQHSGPGLDYPLGEADFVNPRCFEAAACGALLLTDRARGLDKLLRPEREALFFRDAAEAAEIARHYLAHPEQAAPLARAGRAAVLASHTYHHRMETLLEACLGPAGAQAENPRPGAPDQGVARKLLTYLGPG